MEIMVSTRKKFKAFNFRAGKSSVKIFLSILIIFLFATSELFSLESWPSDGDWVAMRNYNWEIYQDPYRKINKDQLDLVPDANSKIAYYYTTSTSIFFRMSLEGSALFGNILERGSWYVALDTDIDNYFDWLIELDSKTQTLYCYPNSYSYPDNTPDYYSNYSVWYPALAGNIRSVPAPTSSFRDAAYLDIQLPYSAFNISGYSKNISYSSSFLILYLIKNVRGVIKEALGTQLSFEGGLSEAQLYTPSKLGQYGSLHDTRDTDPASNGGIWYRNENLRLSGLRWPSRTSPYYNNGNRNAKISDSDNNVLWSGVINTSSTGSIEDFSLTTLGLSLLPGIYNIEIENPTVSGEYIHYDSFEIKAPIVSVQKTTTTPLLSSGSNTSYTIQASNTGNIDGIITSITDILPDGFSYVNGSSSGLTTADPVINGDQITWHGTWAIPVSSSVEQNFQLKTSLVRGEYLNNAILGGDNFAVKNTGPTASVQVKAPSLSLVKTVDNASITPGDIMTYTVHYSNVGDDDASAVFILETIPKTTEYIVSSAEGDGTIITYSDDWGASFGSNQSSAVTHISFQRTSTLTPGSTGSVSFKVRVK